MLGSIIIVTAHNMTAVLIGAAMCAGIFVNQGNFFPVPAEVLPRRYRGVGATITVSAGGFGALVGLPFCGVTIQDNVGGLSWRSTYIFGACINGVAIALLAIFYRPLESSKEVGETTLGALKKHIDWLGAFILAAGVGLLMIGLTLGGSSYPWTSGPVIGTLVGGAVTLVILAIHQIYFNRHGILDHDLWTRNFCVASFGCFVEGIVFFALLLFFPLESATLWESRPFFVNTKDLKNPLIVGWALVLIGFIILTVCGQYSGSVSIRGLFIIGVGFSTPLALLFAVAQLATAPHLLGLTTGQLISARAIGQAIGASVLVAVFEAKVETILPGAVSSAAVSAGLPESGPPQFVGGIAAGNATLIESAPGVTPEIIAAGTQAAVISYVQSFHSGWYTALPFAIIALLLVFLLDGKKIKSQMTWLVERPVHIMEHVHHDDEKHAGRRASIASRASAILTTRKMWSASTTVQT